ncbi:MAG: glyoxylate/hydroxypyruvate reductase [Ramlibacter sp.]|nr:glyoxylate/hydroxypyruvate reductase [Ramlibacter sp.]
MTEAVAFVPRAGYEQADTWLGALRQAMPGETIVHVGAMDEAQRRGVKVAVVANPDPQDLSALPSLCWIHSVWAGVERLVADLGETDLKIVRLVDPQLATTMAEAVLAWTLYLHRDMPAYARQQRDALWHALPYRRPGARTVGLLGLGALGEAAATVLRAAGFKVRGWSRQRKAIDGVECIAGVQELDLLLERSDILVCLLPLTPETTGLLDAARLARLPEGAQLINFARGPIVVEAALKDALDAGHLRHAVLDVFNREPLAADAWEWRHPAVTVLPHISGPTDRETAAQIVAGNVRRWRESGVMPPTVDTRTGY